MSIAGGAVPFGLAALSAALAILICANRERIALWLGVFDLPDRLRKRHVGPVPLVGGAAILVAIAACGVAVLALGLSPDPHLQLVVVLCGLGVGFVGFADDQSHLGAPARLLLLTVFAAIALALDPRLFPAALHWTSAAATPVGPTIFAVLFAISTLGIVNAVNMADGRNGIVGSMFLVWSVCLLVAAGKPVAPTALAMASAGLVFLAFNVWGLVFLGDCGAYGGAFVIGILAASAHASGTLSLETITVWFCLPVLDCLRLIAIRIRQKRSPFSADAQHLHNLLETRLGRWPGAAVYIGAMAGTSLLATMLPWCSPPCLTVLLVGFVVATWPRRREALASQAPIAPGQRNATSRIPGRAEPVPASANLSGSTGMTAP